MLEGGADEVVEVVGGAEEFVEEVAAFGAGAEEPGEGGEEAQVVAACIEAVGGGFV